MECERGDGEASDEAGRGTWREKQRSAGEASPVASSLAALSSMKLSSPENDTSIPFTTYGRSMNLLPCVHTPFQWRNVATQHVMLIPRCSIVNSLCHRHLQYLDPVEVLQPRDTQLSAGVR